MNTEFQLLTLGALANLRLHDGTAERVAAVQVTATLGQLFRFRSASLAEDDDRAVFRPTAIGVGAPGRWHLVQTISTDVEGGWLVQSVPFVGDPTTIRYFEGWQALGVTQDAGGALRMWFGLQVGAPDA